MLLQYLEPGRYVLLDSRERMPLSAHELALRMQASAPSRKSPDLQLLLPASRCLVTMVPVAKHEAKHLAKTLPWTLEERLLEPAEQVHVAHGAVNDGTAPVSAVNAAWLCQVLDDLLAAGIQPQSACSELLLLPWQPGQWTVHIPSAHEAPVIIRHGAHAGFACARGNLHTALQLLLNEHDDAPRDVLVQTEDEAPLDTAALFPVMLQSKLRRADALSLFNNLEVPRCNLLQGRFAPALPWSEWWRQWRVAAALLAGLWLTDIGLAAVEGARLNRAAAANEAAVIELFRRVQPDGAIVDPRLQLEQALAAVGAAGQHGFLTLLGRMAPALQSATGTRVQNIEYDSGSGSVQLQVLTDDLAAENLRAQLQRLGLDAELLGSSNDAAGSRTRLRIGGGA